MKLRGDIEIVELAEHFIVSTGRYDSFFGGDEGEYEEMGAKFPSQVFRKAFRIYCDRGIKKVTLRYDKRDGVGWVFVRSEDLPELNRLMPKFGICLRLLERYYTDKYDRRNDLPIEAEVRK